MRGRDRARRRGVAVLLGSRQARLLHVQHHGDRRHDDRPDEERHRPALLHASSTPAARPRHHEYAIAPVSTGNTNRHARNRNVIVLTETSMAAAMTSWLPPTNNTM